MYLPSVLPCLQGYTIDVTLNILLNQLPYVQDSRDNKRAATSRAAQIWKIVAKHCFFGGNTVFLSQALMHRWFTSLDYNQCTFQVHLCAHL